MNRKPQNDDEPESYRNDEGLTVFTEKFLLDRGYCCGNGCRHCPYDYIEVPEPRRTMLRLQRKMRDIGKKEQ